MHCDVTLCVILHDTVEAVLYIFLEVLLKSYMLQTSQSTEQVMRSKLVM